MGIRFRKSIRFGKGLKINLGKKGASVSIGTKGFHQTFHTSGKRTTSAGIPGTGLSYVNSSGGSKASKRKSTSNNSKTWLWVLGWIFVFPIPLTILMIRNEKLNRVGKIAIIVLAWLLFALLFFLTGCSTADSSTPGNSSSISRTDTKADSTAVQSSVISTLRLENYQTNLILGETTAGELIVEPSGAKISNVVWTSNNENVAKVDSKGKITAVGSGTAIISVHAGTDAETSITVSVDGTKALLNVKITHIRDDENNIGNEWSYKHLINDTIPSQTMKLAIGDNLSFFTEYTESDSKPDIGTATANHIVTAEDIGNGFQVQMEVLVTENAGKNIGKSAHFLTTYNFSLNSSK